MSTQADLPGGFSVSPWLMLAVFASLSLLFALVVLYRGQANKKAMAVFALSVLPLGFVFARLFYALVYLQDSLDNPQTLLDFASSGYVLYGGGLGLMIACLVAARVGKHTLLKIADLVAPAMALMLAFVRLTEGAMGQGYSFYIQNEALWFFPISMYDSYWEAWALALFVPQALYALGLLVVMLKNRSKPGSGDRLALLVFLYAVMQIWFESLRRDAYARIGFIRVMQLISAILAGLVLLYWLVRAKKGIPYVLGRFSAYLALLGLVMLMEFAVEYKVGFLLSLHQTLQLSQTQHYLLCYGTMLLAVLAALMLGLSARKHSLQAQPIKPSNLPGA